VIFSNSKQKIIRSEVTKDHPRVKFLSMHLHTFPKQKSEQWIKPGFIDIVEFYVFTKGILDISFYHSINQKIPSTGSKHNHNVFRECATEVEILGLTNKKKKH